MEVNYRVFITSSTHILTEIYDFDSYNVARDNMYKLLEKRGREYSGRIEEFVITKEDKR